MNVIVVSLERAEQRRTDITTQLKKLNIDAVIYDAFDAVDIINPTFGANLSLVGGYRYGDKFKGGEICCTLSHIAALKMAAALSWEYLIIIEDDFVLATDFEKRIKILLRMLPNNWEHVFLSGIPRFKNYFMPSNLIQLLPSVEKLNRVDTTCAYMVRNIAYNKFIKKLTSFETTTDDLINHLIFKEKQLNSFIYFPFIGYVNDTFSYISNAINPNVHESKPYYVDKL